MCFKMLWYFVVLITFCCHFNMYCILAIYILIYIHIFYMNSRLFFLWLHWYYLMYNFIFNVYDSKNWHCQSIFRFIRLCVYTWREMRSPILETSCIWNGCVRHLCRNKRQQEVRWVISLYMNAWQAGQQ